MMIISFTVRQTVALKEVALAQRLFAVDTDKMLRMPEASKGSNHLQIIHITITSRRQIIRITITSQRQIIHSGDICIDVLDVFLDVCTVFCNFYCILYMCFYFAAFWHNKRSID